MEFSDLELERLANYYQMVLKWNSRLHLTTLTEPAQFFNRHIFESDFAEGYLDSSVNQVWDLGTGLGIPGIPIAILRPSVTVNLVESKRGKVVFLEEAVSALNLTNAKALGIRIESIGDFPADSGLIARAVEQMDEIILRMIASGRCCRQILVLGSENLAEKFRIAAADRFKVDSIPLPGSERRFLINAISST
ncbi:MAG: 16S rRNA (guanine(527)-N(7))-methyltransferase RsmG [Blastocatellia bacterium]